MTTVIRFGDNQGTLIDRFGRPIVEARISLNESSRCNWGCIFCHSEGVHTNQIELITPSEIERITRILFQYGVETVKLTGGEPMLRRDILEIVERLGRIGLREISMTTNGTRLQKLAYDLKDAGLNRVNISLHSLRLDRFSFITQTARLQDSLETIEVAIDAGLTPVKLNVTLLRGVNDDEVEDFIQYSRSLGGGRTNVLQLIELVATEQTFYNRFHVDMLKVEDMIKSRVVRTSFRALHNRLRYHLSDGVIVEIVRPMHNSRFCMGNNRIRITHDGKFKPCLLREDNHIDFITAMRNGASDEELAQIFKQAVLVREPFFKPECLKPVSETQSIALATQDSSSR